MKGRGVGGGVKGRGGRGGGGVYAGGGEVVGERSREVGGVRGWTLGDPTHPTLGTFVLCEVKDTNGAGL